MEHYLAIDQYGEHVHLWNCGKHPRKALLAKLGAKKAVRIYADDEDGHARHIGWAIGQRWFNVYRVICLADE